MDFDPDNIQAWFAYLLLLREVYQQQDYCRDSVPRGNVRPSETNYIAQDKNGHWYGYDYRPKGPDEDGHWMPSLGDFLHLGQTELHDEWHTTYYEVNHDL